MTGTLALICGPSGVGKSSARAREPVSYVYTTRPPRSHEVDGMDKRFVSDGEFARGVSSGSIILPLATYGHQYGFAKEIYDVLSSGKNVVLEVATYDIISHLEEQFAGFPIRKNLILAPFDEQAYRFSTREDKSRTVLTELPNTMKYIDNYHRFDRVRFRLFDRDYVLQRQDVMFLDVQERLCKTLYVLSTIGGTTNGAEWEKDGPTLTPIGNPSALTQSSDAVAWSFTIEDFTEPSDRRLYPVSSERPSTLVKPLKPLSCSYDDFRNAVQLCSVAPGGLEGKDFMHWSGQFSKSSLVHRLRLDHAVRTLTADEQMILNHVNQDVLAPLESRAVGLAFSLNDYLLLAGKKVIGLHDQVPEHLRKDPGLSAVEKTIFGTGGASHSVTALRNGMGQFEIAQFLSHPIFTPLLLMEYCARIKMEYSGHFEDEKKILAINEKYYGRPLSNKRICHYFGDSYFDWVEYSEQQKKRFAPYYASTMAPLLKKNLALFDKLDTGDPKVITRSFIAKWLSSLDLQFISVKPTIWEKISEVFGR